MAHLDRHPDRSSADVVVDRKSGHLVVCVREQVALTVASAVVGHNLTRLLSADRSCKGLRCHTPGTEERVSRASAA